eukprot:Sdes_comp20645_c0_seq1m15857
MLARTKYHNCSGTRCKMDFVEIPSILMEYFASDPRVLQQFARHYKTGKPIPENLLSIISLQKKMFSAIDLQQQIYLAMLDQTYHGTHPLNGSVNQVAADVQNKYTLFPALAGISPQMQFNHLFGYGASYYTYIWSRAFASKIWKELFSKNPTCRSSGEKYRTQMLSKGGSQDPNVIMEALLGHRPTIEQLVSNLVQEMESAPRG